MPRHLSWFVIAVVLWAVASPIAGQDGATKTLVGTWRLVSAKYGGQKSTLPNDATTLKYFTPTHYVWMSYTKNGKVARMAGGPYSFNGKTLEDTPQFGVGDAFDLVRAKHQTFECKVEGKTLYQSGKLSSGLSLEEVWELVE